MSSTVNSYDYSPYWLQTSNNKISGSNVTTTAPEASVSVFTDANQTGNTAAVSNSVLSDECDDGKDDGKISLWSGICAFGKGVVKSAVNTVTGILTDPKKLIATAATAALCVAFPPAGVALGVVGAVTGGISLAKSASTAYDVYKNGGTDAETKAAIQDAGAATLQIGLSVAGTKASFNAMKGTAGSALNNLSKNGKVGFNKDTASAFIKDVKTGGRAGGGEGYLGTRAALNVKNNIDNKGVIKGIQKSAGEAFDKVKTTMTNRAAQKEYNKYEKMDEAGQKDFLKEMSDDIDKAKTKQADAQKAVDALKKQGAEAESASAELKAELETATNELKIADKNLAKAEARQTNFENAKTTTNTVQSKYEAAKKAAEDAQKAIDKATENGGKATEAQLEALNKAQAELKTAKADARLTSSNPAKYYTQSFSTVAKNANYNSGFGALTTPVATVNGITNSEDMTLEIAQQNAALKNTTFGSATVSSNRTINTQFEHRDYAAIAEQANADVMKTLNYYGY